MDEFLLALLTSFAPGENEGEGGENSGEESNTPNSGEESNTPPKRKENDEVKSARQSGFRAAQKRIVQTLERQGYDIIENDDGEVDIEATLAKGKKPVSDEDDEEDSKNPEAAKARREKAELQKRLDSLQRREQEREIDNEILSSMPKGVIDKDDVVILLKSKFDIRESNGKFRVFRKGTKQLVRDKYEQPVSIERALQGLIKKKPHLVSSDYRKTGENRDYIPGGTKSKSNLDPHSAERARLKKREDELIERGFIKKRS